ncbi:MAG: hypothetical protein JWO15_1965 [Sphingomonadales bacterium]|nr:hypothetical protein [Sphingomonadales bacterium]
MSRWLVGGILAVVGLAAAAPAIQNAVEGNPGEAPIAADNLSVAAPTVPQVAPKASPAEIRAATPMAERVATIGILNKRNGLSRDLKMRPGDAVHIGDAVVRLKACDQTEPWEKDQLTGAFVQLIVHGADDKWRKVFSGWLFKESPSLNVVQHPIYDVWVKACTMRHPDVGPNTVVLSGESSGGVAKSKARKSAPADDSADEPDIAPPTAAPSNAL